MNGYILLSLRLLLIILIAIMSFLILTKLITWPERSKAKRTGQITEDTESKKRPVVKIYILIWVIFVFIGYILIRYTA